MPDVILTERDQHLLRTLMACQPVPGSPIPERRVLEMIGELVPSDSVVVVLRENRGPMLSFAEVPSGTYDFEDAPNDWCTLKVGTIHWSRHPREAEACKALVGFTDGISVGFRNGSNAVAQIGLDRVKHMYSARDLAVLDLLGPVLQRQLRTQPTPALPTALTVAERRVLNQVAAGLSNSQIAECLFVAPSTVRKHLENIYSKLGVTNRMAAVVAIRGAPLTDPERARQVKAAS
jgi:DNA-binding CsgD family transcriptional regulator